MTKRRILIADDDFVSRKLICEILKNEAAIDVAANGKEAVEAHRIALTDGRPYGLILLDISMPEIDGIEAAQRIRQQEAMAGTTPEEAVPIIMVTVHRGKVCESFLGGGTDYVIKPIVARRLLEKVRKKMRE